MNEIRVSIEQNSEFRDVMVLPDHYYGKVELTFTDGQLVHIVKTESVKMPKPGLN